VRGYRAPSFSIGRQTPWAFDMLAEAGYAYSSSIYPIAHDHYGMPDAPRFPFHPQAHHPILEIPVTTVNAFGHRLPCGGGGYFRLLPYAFSSWALRQVNGQDRRPGMFYFHPWEIDPAQPRVDGVGTLKRFRHYVNLDRMEAKLITLLKEFSWDRVDRTFGC
jgi:polysaccharide deacetylase family protein (PEP-CTERM system associated)